VQTTSAAEIGFRIVVSGLFLGGRLHRRFSFQAHVTPLSEKGKTSWPRENITMK
jgi:hypothetical protein